MKFLKFIVLGILFAVAQSMSVIPAVASGMPIPAKPGVTRSLTLTDGTTVVATLVGDEHGHYWLGQDGRAYLSITGTDTYQPVDAAQIQRKAAVRRANANQRRMNRMPRKIGSVGSITGQKKGLIILVNFTDVSFQSANNKALYQRIANEENFSYGSFKGSMYDYFKAQSEGQFELTFDVVGPVTVSKAQAYYGGNDSKGNDKYPATMVIEALKLVDPQVNFADYDWDGDGEVEQVYVVYAGNGAADSDVDDAIWPHEWTLSSANYYGDGAGRQRLDNVYIDTYACGGELNGSNNIAGIGTMCHEFSHCLGYPDFYDTDYSGGQGMGYWDLMDSGSYNDNGYQPAGYTSYERWVAGWKEPAELLNTQSVSSMAALQTTGSNTYVIYNKANNNEYYLLENRQKTGWDSSLPGAGLLVLHVDYSSSAWENNEPNDDPSHQRMTWIPADNQYQYTTNSDGSKSYTFSGMKNDPFPYGNVKAFNKTTTPAAKFYNKNSDNSYYLDSSVENITQNSDGTISFNFVGSGDVVEPTPSDEALLYEGLKGYNETDDSTAEINTSDQNLDYRGWGTFSKIYAGGINNAYNNGGCLKFGSSKAAGSMTSGNISLTGSGTLTFYLKQYSSDTGKLNVTVTGATADVTQFTPSSSWTLCTVNLTNATDNVTISLATSSKRAYVDEITLRATTSPVTSTPELITDPETLTFEAEANASQVKTFDILGADLTENVSISLSDENQVFSITPTTISKADAEEGASVSVTFAPKTAGSYTGTVTVASAGAESVEVSLSGTATESTTPVDPTPTGNEFTLLTKSSDFTEGDYIIVYDGGAMNTEVSSNRLQYTDVTPSNNVITTTDATIIWHIAPSGDHYTIYNAGENKYAASNGTKNQAQLLASGSDDKSLWTVTTGSTFEFVNKYNETNTVNANLRRNGTYGFACYASGTGGALSLYKRTGSSSGGDDPTPDPSTDYYQPADGKTGVALKTAMCGIIYNRTEKSYDDLWNAFKTTDVRSDGKIWDMYSDITNYTPVTSGSNYSKEGDCYNREHSWPQSWFGSNAPMYTDLHHIYPTDGFVNGKRANYPFGEVSNPTYSSENSFSKLGPCSYSGYTGTVFEPADEYKGDFARTYFYMVTCYEEKLHDWYTNYNSTDVVHVIDGSTYPGLQEWQLNMLMEWAKNDPVSEKETARNEAVYAIQNNRNPFIDYPGLQEYIWGFMTSNTFSYDHYIEPVYNKQDVTMAFSPAEATATVGEDFTEPTLTTSPAGLAVTYGSSSTGVATVNASTGEVTLVAAGTTTITATFAGNDNYNASTASYTLKVNGLNSISLSEASKNVAYAEGAFSLTATVPTKNYDGTLTAESSNEYVATVEVNGTTVTITPKAVGSATITVTAGAGTYYPSTAQAVCDVSVTAPEGGTTAPGSGSGETLLLFGESFGENSGSARAWDDSYSVKSGISDVYSGITGYTISNAKQSKNTMGSTLSGLTQTAQGTDAYIIIGPLNVADYSNLNLTYQWKAASIKGTYSTSVFYATSSEGTYTEVTGSGNGATSFVTRAYTLPETAQSSTLYLKIVWNTSNTQGIIDEVRLSGESTAASTTTVPINQYGYATYCSELPIDFSSTEGYTAWRISSIADDGTITFEKITEKIKGGQGVLLYNTDADGVNQSSATITFAAGDTEFSDAENKFVGTTAPTYVDVAAAYGLATNKFVKNNAAGVIPAGKAYIPAAEIPSNVRAFTFVFNDPMTGISETQRVSPEDFGAIFNLAGQRLNQPQKGVIIVNGKKILVK